MNRQHLNQVMCVNDNEITLFIFKRLLAKSRFSGSAIDARNGKEALEHCRNFVVNGSAERGEYPRLIFLDLHMPLMDGWEFLEAFREEIYPHFPETKIVVTSQSINAADSARSRDYEFVVDFHSATITIDYLDQLYSEFTEQYTS